MGNVLFKKFRRSFYLSVVCVIISSLALLCIPSTDINGVGTKKVLAYVTAAVFWLSLFISQIFFWSANSKRKIIERELKKRKIKTINSKPGLVSFFKNKPAITADAGLFFSAVLLAITTCFHLKNEWLIIGCVFLLFLTFNLHCLLNGKNYKYIQNYKVYLNSKEQQKYE